jgi:hypothetical protein
MEPTEPQEPPDEIPKLGAGLDLSDPYGPLAPYYAGNGGIVAALLIALLAAIFAHQPLWNTDIWGHAAYGRWISTHGLPEREPLSHYTDPTVRFGPFSWLAQWGYARLASLGRIAEPDDTLRQIQIGAEWIRFVHWAAQVLTFVVFWMAVRGRGVTSGVANVAFVVMCVTCVSVLGIQRPQAFGALFFVVVLCVSGKETVTRRALFGLPLLFALWANIHGSFAIALLFLGLQFVGRWIELFRAKAMLLENVELRRRVLLIILCTLATLANPRGPMLYPEILALGNHPNIQTISEWQMLNAGQGLAVLILAISGTATLATLAFHCRVVKVADVLLAVILLGWGILQQRMLLWWFLSFAWICVPYWQMMLSRYRPNATPPALSFRKTLVVVAVAFFGLMLTPWVDMVQGRFQRDPDTTFTQGTCWPLAMELNAEGNSRGKWIPALDTALKQNYPEGRYTGPIFATETQGDFLLYTQPQERPVLMFSHAHAFPAAHWKRCIEVKAGDPAWRRTLDEWKANLIVAEPAYNRGLTDLLRGDPDWIIVLDEENDPKIRDPRARKVVALRKKP